MLITIDRNVPKLKHHDGGKPPDALPPFDRNPGGWAFPRWGQLAIAFLLGALAMGTLPTLSIWYAVAAFASFAGFVLVAAWFRWR
jgi:hypothetical protein